MSALAATNDVQPTPHSHVYGGVRVNPAIPVGGIEPWRREAVQKVIRFSNLQPNWDGRGSPAPSMAVRQKAFEFIMGVPDVGAPRVVPTSGGGYHFEWSAAARELEISIEPDCRIEALRVVDGMPVEEAPAWDLAALFRWLVSK